MKQPVTLCTMFLMMVFHKILIYEIQAMHQWPLCIPLQVTQDVRERGKMENIFEHVIRYHWAIWKQILASSLLCPNMSYTIIYLSVLTYGYQCDTKPQSLHINPEDTYTLLVSDEYIWVIQCYVLQSSFEFQQTHHTHELFLKSNLISTGSMLSEKRYHKTLKVATK